MARKSTIKIKKKSATEIEQFQQQLLDWYAENKRDLPWRKTNDVYKIWLSEVMLQQTQVKTVIPYYHRFLEKFPYLQSVAKADLQDVLKLWEGLGYYSRARNFYKACQFVVENYKSEIPLDYENFRKLSGVGDYIAAAVTSIAKNAAYPVLDGNVKRVLARIFKIKATVNNQKNYPIFKQYAEQAFFSEKAGDYNQAIMELGALVCIPGTPSCEKCPVNNLCDAKSVGMVADYPKREKKAALKTRRFVVAVIKSQDQYFIIKRAGEQFLGEMWQFPSFETFDNEQQIPLLKNSLFTKFGLNISDINFIGEVKHTYTHFHEKLFVYFCTEQYLAKSISNAHWVDLAEINRLPLIGSNHKIFGLLKTHNIK